MLTKRLHKKFHYSLFVLARQFAESGVRSGYAHGGKLTSYISQIVN